MTSSTRRPRALALPLVLALLVALAVVGVARPGSTASAAPLARTYVSLTFDDSDDGQVLAERSLARHGLAGTFYTMTGWVDTPGFLTRSDLTRFAADGMEIGGHSMTHPDLTAVSDDEVRRQLCGDRATLESWGFHPTSHAYPMTRVDARVERIAQQCGYVTARGGRVLARPGTCPSCVHAETRADVDRYAVRALESVSTAWTLDTLKRAVTDAAEGSGGWVVLTFHQFCTDSGPGCPPSQSLDPGTFEAFAAWLASYTADPARSTVVATVDAVARAGLGADYPGYTPAPRVADHEPPAGTNLVPNASLEEPDPAGSGLPRCFSLGGWGDNDRSAAVVHPGRTGSTAVEVRLSHRASGDAKLVPALDMGTCSATVSEGHRYTASVSYRSTVPAAIVVYARTAAGQWYAWRLAPPVPAADGWATATATTPPVPAGVTGLAFGLAIEAPGTVTTDDYSLVRAR